MIALSMVLSPTPVPHGCCFSGKFAQRGSEEEPLFLPLPWVSVPSGFYFSHESVFCCLERCFPLHVFQPCDGFAFPFTFVCLFISFSLGPEET